MSRLYVEDTLRSGASLTLSDSASHYLGTVLRLKTGDTVRVFNGEQGEFSATISGGSKKSLQLILGAQTAAPKPPLLQIHLGLGLSRGERMDYALQKSTELGVSSITPIICEHGEVRFNKSVRVDNKMRHWQKVLSAATEQSGRLAPPLLQRPMLFNDWLQQQHEGPALILDPDGECSIRDLPIETTLTLLTGPEGGFSEVELGAARAKGLKCVRLGPRILRAETAPAAALAVLQTLYGDLG